MYEREVRHARQHEASVVLVELGLHVEADADTARKVFRLIDALEDSDDVQNIFTNIQVPDDVQALLDDED